MDSHRRTAQKPTDDKAVPGPASSLRPALLDPPRAKKWLALGPSADTETAASSAGGNQPVSLGPGQGPSPSLGATSRDKGLCAVPLSSNEKPSLGTARPQADPLATDDRLSSIRGQSGQGDNQSPGWPAGHFRRPWRSQAALVRAAAASVGGGPAGILHRGRVLARRDREMSFSPGLCAPSFPRLSARSAQNNKRGVGAPRPRDWLPPPHPGEPSQGAAGSLQEKVKGEGARPGVWGAQALLRSFWGPTANTACIWKNISRRPRSACLVLTFGLGPAPRGS